MLKIGVSGLLASQRALATTANNITNASTEGYSRQRVNFSSQTPNFLGGNFIGTGVRISSIERLFDEFLSGEIRTGLSAEGRLQTFAGLSGRVGNIVGGPDSGISTGLQSFFTALEGLSNDPSSTPVRQVVLSEAQSLSQRFNTLDAQLDGVSREVDGRVRSTVDEINNLADSIARINRQIFSSAGVSVTGDGPNDLLDQREQLIAQLSSKVAVSTVDQGDGIVNVFIGNGQALVLSDRATRLSVGTGGFGPQGQEIRIGNTPVTRQLSGGELGGLLEFRREILEPTRNELGLLATAVATEFNRLSREGLDLNGNAGTDLFGLREPQIFETSGNTGASTLQVSIAELGGLTGQDYQLSFNGTNFSLVNQGTGQSVPLTADQQNDLLNGEAVELEGLRFQFSTIDDPANPGNDIVDLAPGSRFLVRPTAGAAGSITTLISDPARLAAAGTVRDVAASPANSGTGTISFSSTLDPENPALDVPVTIRIGSDAVTGDLIYELLDADGTVLAGPEPFVAGEEISFNGWAVQISGAPAAGDEFTVQGNSGGVGDNRNALRLAGLFSQPLLADGSTSLFNRSDALVSRVGSATAAANTALSAQRSLLESSRAAQQAISGVNLEEEAANLVRFQQSFEASAQVIRVSDTIFQSLLAAVR